MDVFVIIMCVTVTIAVLFFLVVAILYFAKGVQENRKNPSVTRERASVEKKDAPVEPDLTPSPVEKKPAKKSEPAPLIKRQVEPTYQEPVYQEPVYQAPTPAPVVEEPIVEETATTTIEGPSVAFGVSGHIRKEFEEAYQDLPYRKKQWCDTLLKEISALEKARVKEGKYARTVLQGQDTIAKVQFVKGEICVDCTIVNPELKVYGKASGTKIKPKPMRFKITDEHQLDAALFTIKVANQTSLEARQKKRVKKTDAE